MIITIGIEKVFDKIQYPFMIKKNSLEGGDRRKIPQYNKDHI